MLTLASGDRLMLATVSGQQVQHHLEGPTSMCLEQRLSRRCRWGRAALVGIAAASYGTVILATAPVETPAISGSWTLQESTGDLPDRATRMVDGTTLSEGSVTIRIDRADGYVTVRRGAPHTALLRVMTFEDREAASQVARDALVSGRAEWHDRTLVLRGDITIKLGFVKRRVPFEEHWQFADDDRTLTVTLTLHTPKGVKRRRQAFDRERTACNADPFAAQKNFVLM